MRTVIGVDAGGTSTRAIVTDGSGRCWALGRAGAGNPVSAGREQAIDAIVAACGDALGAARERTGSQISPELVLVSMAGGAAIGGRLEGLHEALAAGGIEAPHQVAPDSMSTYFSATTEPDGGVVIAGTGAVAVVVRHGRPAGVVDGAGWLIGDDGSGFWLGRRVVHAAVAATDGRGPATTLTDRLTALLPPTGADLMLGGDDRRTQIVHGVYALRPVELARFAPLAFEEAERDQVAASLIDEATAALQHTVDTLLTRVPEGPIVLGGGVFASVIGDRIAAGLGDRAHRAHDGTVGAAVMGLREIGVDVTPGRHAEMVSSLTRVQPAPNP